jgi:hypothetical protein
MGVDYSAFGGFGASIEVNDDYDFEDPLWDLEKVAGKDFRVRDWGGLAYGCKGGYILMLEAASVGVDLQRGSFSSFSIGDPKKMTSTLQRGIDLLKEAGMITGAGKIGFIVGGCVS